MNTGGLAQRFYWTFFGKCTRMEINIMAKISAKILRLESEVADLRPKNVALKASPSSEGEFISAEQRP